MSTVDVEIIIKPDRRRKPHQEARAAQAAATPRIPRIARLMALAIRFQEMVDCGEVRDYADLARLGYVTRARLTQIMNLLLLAPEIQEEILPGQAIALSVTETDLRRVVAVVPWPEQYRVWGLLANRTTASSK